MHCVHCIWFSCLHDLLLCIIALHDWLHGLIKMGWLALNGPASFKTGQWLQVSLYHISFIKFAVWQCVYAQPYNFWISNKCKSVLADKVHKCARGSHNGTPCTLHAYSHAHPYRLAVVRM